MVQAMNRVEAIIIGGVLGIGISIFEIFVFAGIYLIINILCTIWYLRGYIVFVTLIVYTVIQLLKTQTGD